MKNKEIAKIFNEIADYLEAEGIQFKPYAYRKAALNLETIKDDVGLIYQKGGKKALEKIPGIGKNMAEEIEEYLKKGLIKKHLQFKKKLPLNLEEITAVEGIGPKKAKVLYQKLGVKSLKDLEKAACAHKIRRLFGFDEKTERNILEAIQFLKKDKGRFLLGEILPLVRETYEKLRKLKEVEKIDYAGSIRRMKETIGDVDFLVVSKKPEKVIDFFVALSGVVKIWSKGKTRASVRMEEGFDMDIRVIPKKSYGSALQYFTGSKEHNIITRKIALEKGLKLSEYGLFKGSKMIAGETEEGIYRVLGMLWIPPEIRENQGEIESALKGSLPNLVQLKDIKGDLHCHSNWNGGDNSIEDIVKAAQERGYDYIGIADHTKFLRIENGLDEKQLEKRNKEIDNLNLKLKKSNLKFRILKGCEANIMPNGSIDIKDKALESLDYVIAGIHSSFKMSKEKMTQRMIKAMQNPNVDIISHPTGRLLKEREQYDIDLDKIIKTAKETGTILEINSYPKRLDLNDQNIRKAKKLGVKMVINTDAHHKDQLKFIEFGVAQAKRGWAEKEDIINCWPLEKLLEFLK